MENTSQSTLTVSERSDYKVIDVVLPNGKRIELTITDGGLVQVSHYGFVSEERVIISRLDRVTIDPIQH